MVDSSGPVVVSTRQRRPHLLIAGDDLKFIEPMIGYLERHFVIRFDHWTGPEGHDREHSLELLKWADIIHCEWMLGNAVWYSWNKSAHQKLIVRVHLFELSREYGFLPNRDAIDKVIVVSRPTFERAVSTFRLPREIVQILPNAIAMDGWKSDKPYDQSRSFRIAMVGAVPSRKGLRRALRILKVLKEHDERYCLELFGRQPHDVDWVWSNPEERDYFSDCTKKISEWGLEGSVRWRGWSAMDQHWGSLGFVLSLSDEESFHVAPVEGAVHGVLPVILPWPGAHWIHPDCVLVDDPAAAVDFIVDHQQQDSRQQVLDVACDFYNRYDARQVAQRYTRLVSNL
ncbi:hypothetical protein ACFSSC_11835 [Corynebacterium mendelii]|uniref:Glycosyltransferase n=1 Tax=Corynebacterium mendelii TaxID=2765362 RepID=A0A939IYN5_9CORY|nr:hypothetical protein [Corynebacterium mendelii]MBN9645308.1 hypothetical protein [Corynebacterium mendelii]